MNSESIPSLDDVLDTYALEADNDNATLERYLREYPQYAAELVELSRELDRPLDVSTAPLDAKERALIAKAWTQFSSIHDSAVSSSPLVWDPAKMKAIASAFGVPRQIISAFREGRVILESVPHHFLERLAKALGATYEVLRTSLACAPDLATSRSYKADEKPKAPQQVTFEQLLIDACVSSEKKAELLAEGY
jgi:transcriptional regulator with XRE-family HTH domain